MNTFWFIKSTSFLLKIYMKFLWVVKGSIHLPKQHLSLEHSKIYARKLCESVRSTNATSSPCAPFLAPKMLTYMCIIDKISTHPFFLKPSLPSCNLELFLKGSFEKDFGSGYHIRV